MGVTSTRVHPQSPARAEPASWGRCLLAALPAWLLARAIVVAIFAIASDRHGSDVLLVWDAAWYHNLGVHGYLDYGPQASRFFPLLPLVVGAGHLVGLPTAVWLTAACWIAALFFAAGVYRLTILESGSPSAGTRAVWLVQLVPGAGVLALGYTEALAGLLAVLYFLALRHGSTSGGMAAGVRGGLARPTGLLLAIPGLIHTSRALMLRIFGSRDRSPASAQRAAMWRAVLLTAAPLAGTAAYLAWAWVAFGDPFTPYRVQSADDLRGGVIRQPWEYLFEDSPGGYPWQLVLTLLVVAAVALVLCAWRLPLSYVAWSLPMVGLAVTAWGLHSLPRYLAAVFPLWMAVAVVCRNRWVWWTVLAAGTAGFTWVAYLVVAPASPVP